MSGSPRLIFLTISLYCLLWANPLIAQSQAEQSALNANAGLGVTYFVDEAGLQMIENAVALGEFIDPAVYQLGPYDVISIQGSGKNEFTYRALTINASGDILVPVAGLISLKGLTLQSAAEVVNEKFSDYFKDTRITLSLEYLRPINVHVGGNIPNPGRYVIPAGTRFDALVNGFLIGDQLVSPLTNSSVTRGLPLNANRPSVSGINFETLNQRAQENDQEANSIFNELSGKFDFRLIKVRHSDGTEDFIDLKAYFNSGNTSFAPFIRDGDQITMIENASSRTVVSISGAVNQPFSGTHRSDDTFEKLILIAGGYLPESDSSEVILVRNDGLSTEKIRLPVSQIGKVQPGDQFIIPFKKDLSNTGTVELIGEIEIPGSYPISDGQTTLYDIIKMADGITDEALPNGAFLIRDPGNSNKYNDSQNQNLTLLMKSSDQFVEGFDYLEMEEALSPNRMPLDLTRDSLLKTTVLRKGDKIYVPRDHNSITLLGQLNNPGFYTFDSTMIVQDYLFLAGGTTVAADIQRIYVIKAGSNTWFYPQETRIESGDIIFVDRVPFEDVSSARNYQVQIEQLRNNRIQLIIAGIGTLASIFTAYAAIARI